MRRKNASAVVYLMFFFVVLLAFCAFAVDSTIIFTARAKLQNATESAAMAGASMYGVAFGSGEEKDSALSSYPLKAFDVYKGDDLENAKATSEYNDSLQQIRVTSSCLCQPYFLAFLGISTIKINATAVAISESMPVTANYSSINWITASAAYLSDIVSNPDAKGDGSVSTASNYNDTAILLPVGNFESGSVDSDTGNMHFDYLAKGDSTPLSLGPGGFITIKLPAPIVDKPGKDLYISEMGHSQEGYFVFAGLDKDPKNPYVQHDRPGAGILWKNISCSGTTGKYDYEANLGAYEVQTPSFGNQAKFYGSGYFDLGASCSGVSMAKYIRIIDDNNESAFVKDTIGTMDGKYYKAMMTGESSTITSGADIDYVEVLNHVRLIAPKYYGSAGPYS